jgi:hypothetical protein
LARTAGQREWTQEDRWYFADWIEFINGAVILFTLVLARLIGGEAAAE